MNIIYLTLAALVGAALSEATHPAFWYMNRSVFRYNRKMETKKREVKQCEALLDIILTDNLIILEDKIKLQVEVQLLEMKCDMLEAEMSENKRILELHQNPVYERYNEVVK